MKEIIPLFSSDYSIRSSILTLDTHIFKKDEKGNKTKEFVIEENKSVSIFAISKVHNIRPVLVESSMNSYWNFFEGCQEFKIDGVFGLKICVCKSGEDKSDDSRLTESNVIIFLNNSQGYTDLIPIFSKAATNYVYYKPRIDWKSLNELWTPNLSLAIPFYSSFLARNLLYHGRAIVPEINQLKPLFFIEEHGLPFDNLIREGLEAYLQENPYPTQRAHSAYYYKDEDYLAYQTLRCMVAGKRRTLSKPNLENFGSQQFSFESYQRKVNQ